MKDIRLWGILILALAVRTVMLFSVFADTSRSRTPPSGDYDLIADILASSRQYSTKHQFPPERLGETWIDGPEILHPPGYPSLLAGAVWVFPKPPAVVPWVTFRPRRRRPSWYPPPPRTGESEPFLKVILALQVLLDLHLVMLTFLLGRALMTHGVGLAAALFQAVSPLAVAASCRILPDSIFAFLLAAGVVLLIRHFRTGGWTSLVMAGLVMGGACYFQPVGLAFSAVMVLVLVCRPKRLRRTAAFAAVVAACTTPWIVRNAMVADYWGFSNFVTEGAYWHSAAEFEASRQHVAAEEMRLRLIRAEGWVGPYRFDRSTQQVFTPTRDGNAPCNRTPGGLAGYRWQKAREIILAHPWEYLGIHLRGDTAFWLPGATDALEVMGCKPQAEGTLDVVRRQGVIAAANRYGGENTMALVSAGVIIGITLIRYLGVILCGLWRLRLRMTAAGWLCLLLVLTAWLLPGPANSPRFRVQVEPILSAAAAIGWLGLVGWWRRRGADKAEGKAPGTA